MVSIDNTFVLSNVHTDCQFQIIPESNRAVTRFKLYLPSASQPKFLKAEEDFPYDQEQDSIHNKTPKACLPNVAENESRRRIQVTEDDIESELSTKSGDELQLETELQYDEDGDLIVDRNPFRADCSNLDRKFYGNEDSRISQDGEIKLDLPNIHVVDEERQDDVHVSSDYPDRKYGAEKTTKDIRGVTCNSLSKDFTDTCKHCGHCDIADCKSESLLQRKKPYDIHAQRKHPYEGKLRKMVSKSKHSEGITDITVQSSVCTGGTTGVSSHEHKENFETRTESLQDSNGDQETSARDLDTKFDVHYLSIKHSLATGLENVGEQVWHGALLLSDYIISYHGDIENKTIVDLGAGVGLSSIVAAMYAKTVFCTDTGEKVLSLAEDNVNTATTCPTLPRPLCTVLVKELDWFTGLEVGDCKHGLTEDDITSIYNCDILIAADVIYDFDLTDAFFNVVKEIMTHPPAKTLFIGLEKRLVFTVVDLAVSSPGYNYFRLHLDDLCTSEGDDAEVCFKVEQIDAKFQQYFWYQRTKQLEVWKITAVFQKS